MDSETSLSLPTTTSPGDYTTTATTTTTTTNDNQPYLPKSSLPLRSLGAQLSDTFLPWGTRTSNDTPLASAAAAAAQEEKQQQQEEQRAPKRRCAGLFNGFMSCKRKNDEDNDNDGNSSVSSASSVSDIGSHRSVQELSQRALPHFPSPSLLFPLPALEFDFRLSVLLRPEPSKLSPPPQPSTTSFSPFSSSSSSPQPNRTSATTPSGPSQQQQQQRPPQQQQQQREITAVSSGSWSGSFGHGKVLAGGYDLGQARGFRPIRIVEGVFVMQTTDDTPAILEMRTRGSLSGPSSILDSLLSSPSSSSKPIIDPRRYGFRMFSTIKTTDKRYAEIVNCGLWVASGVWRGDELIIDAYRVT